MWAVRGDFWWRPSWTEASRPEASTFRQTQSAGSVQIFAGTASRIGQRADPWWTLTIWSPALKFWSTSPSQPLEFAMEQMTRTTDAILFSSVPDEFTEPTHSNIRSVMYWLRLFREFQFYPDPRFDASFIAPHAFLVRKRASVDPEELLLSFNETIRNRIYRAAFLTRQERIEHLERDLASLTANISSETRTSEQLQSQLTYLQTELLSAQERTAWMEEDRNSSRSRTSPSRTPCRS